MKQRYFNIKKATVLLKFMKMYHFSVANVCIFFNNRTMVHTVQLISINAVDWGFKLNTILTINNNHYWSDCSYWWLKMLNLVKVDKWFPGCFRQQSCFFFPAYCSSQVGIPIDSFTEIKKETYFLLFLHLPPRFWASNDRFVGGPKLILSVLLQRNR